MKKFINSFKYAIKGFIHCIKNERNFRIHVIVAILVIGIALFLELSTYEYILILLAVALVLICEMINTAIERTIDAITECSVDCETEKLDGLRKVAKDVAAGAVLISAWFAVCVGVIIFGERVFELIRGAF